MSDAEKAPALARAEVVAPPLAPAPSRRAKLFAALLGLLLLGGGAWLLWVFSENPSGELPWLPGTWKGAPLILGACFGGVYGALLLILRRFSLRGMLLCSVLSAALAGGLTAYVQTITETQTIRGSVKVGKKGQDELLAKLREKVTQERVFHFLQALREAGKLDGVQDFQAMDLSFALSKSGDGIECKVEFEFLTYLQPATSPLRAVATRYVRTLIALYSIHQKFANPVAEYSYLGVGWTMLGESHECLVVVVEFIFNNLNGLKALPRESDFLIPMTSDKTFDPYLGLGPPNIVSTQDAVVVDLMRRAQWLAEAEEDPNLKECIAKLQEVALSFVHPNKISIPQSVKPMNSSSEN